MPNRGFCITGSKHIWDSVPKQKVMISRSDAVIMVQGFTDTAWIKYVICYQLIWFCQHEGIVESIPASHDVIYCCGFF